MGLLRPVAAAVFAALTYRAVVRGDLTLDVGVGRRTRSLDCDPVRIDAPRETVFDVIASPYLGRTPRALAGKLEVIERGSDMVLAAHHTPVGPGLVATTVETVRFERPERIHFRLLRGPVPHVVELFELTAAGDGVTQLAYTGEMGTDFGPLGAWWADQVAEPWQAAVRATFASVKAEAERRHGGASRGG